MATGNSKEKRHRLDHSFGPLCAGGFAALMVMSYDFFIASQQLRRESVSVFYFNKLKFTRVHRLRNV